MYAVWNRCFPPYPCKAMSWRPGHAPQSQPEPTHALVRQLCTPMVPHLLGIIGWTHVVPNRGRGCHVCGIVRDTTRANPSCPWPPANGAVRGTHVILWTLHHDYRHAQSPGHADHPGVSLPTSSFDIASCACCPIVRPHGKHNKRLPCSCCVLFHTMQYL